MNIKFKNYQEPKFLQEGGEIPNPNGATATAPAEQDPMMQLVQAAAQAIQTQDANLAMQVCQALVQMAGGGAETPTAPEGQQPVYRKGGKFSKWISK